MVEYEKVYSKDGSWPHLPRCIDCGKLVDGEWHASLVMVAHAMEAGFPDPVFCRQCFPDHLRLEALEW